MSLELVYLPEVSRDFAEAFFYYEARSSHAALGFEIAFGSAKTEVELDLVIHQRIFEHYHRVFIGNFPYNLYDRLSGTRTAVIVALLHSRFSPERISATLRERAP